MRATVFPPAMICLWVAAMSSCSLGTIDSAPRSPCEHIECPTGQTCRQGTCLNTTEPDSGSQDGRDTHPTDADADSGTASDAVDAEADSPQPDCQATGCEVGFECHTDSGTCIESDEPCIEIVAGVAQMPADDPLCGVIDCDGLDEYYVQGDGSPEGSNERWIRDYEDLTTNRCAALGRCKNPNGNDCNLRSDRLVDTCGTCEQATTSGCATYADGTGCGGQSHCFERTCAAPCDTHDDGTVPCDTLCSWCRGDCVGAITDDGRVVPCDHSHEPMWCFCIF